MGAGRASVEGSDLKGAVLPFESNKFVIVRNGEATSAPAEDTNDRSYSLERTLSVLQFPQQVSGRF